MGVTRSQLTSGRGHGNVLLLFVYGREKEDTYKHEGERDGGEGREGEGGGVTRPFNGREIKH